MNAQEATKRAMNEQFGIKAEIKGLTENDNLQDMTTFLYSIYNSMCQYLNDEGTDNFNAKWVESHGEKYDDGYWDSYDLYVKNMSDLLCRMFAAKLKMKRFPVFETGEMMTIHFDPNYFLFKGVMMEADEA